MWVYTKFPHLMGQVLLFQALVTSIACLDNHWIVFVYWSPFCHEMWDPWGHVCHCPYIPRAKHSFWFIIDFNRKQKDFNRNLTGINMFPLVLLVAPRRKLFLREFFSQVISQNLLEFKLFYWIEWPLFSWWSFLLSILPRSFGQLPQV